LDQYKSIDGFLKDEEGRKTYQTVDEGGKKKGSKVQQLFMKSETPNKKMKVSRYAT